MVLYKVSLINVTGKMQNCRPGGLQTGLPEGRKRVLGVFGKFEGEKRLEIDFTKCIFEIFIFEGFFLSLFI